MTIKPTPMEIETIFDAACQLFTDKATAAELDEMRHTEFAERRLGHTGIADQTRKDAAKKSREEGIRNARLAEICRQMREHCHANNLGAILTEALK